MVASGRVTGGTVLPGPDVFDSDSVDAAVIAHAAPTKGRETGLKTFEAVLHATFSR